MPPRSSPRLLLALFCALACCVAPLSAGGDPGTQFLLAYQAFQAATKLEVDGKPDDARKKYAFCEGLLEQLVVLSGARAPNVDHEECVTLGDTACLFRATWKGPT